MSHKKMSGNSSSRISALGADGGAEASSLNLREMCCSSFLVYKTWVMKYTTKTLHFRRLFSMMPITSINTRLRKKYKIDASFPMMLKGCSTGCPPIHVSVNRSATSTQYRHWLRGRNVMLCCLDMWSIGINARIKTEMTRAGTPPNFLGIDRKIAYANRKYHSGLTCGGVLRGFAGVS